MKTRRAAELEAISGLFQRDFFNFTRGNVLKGSKQLGKSLIKSNYKQTQITDVSRLQSAACFLPPGPSRLEIAQSTAQCSLNVIYEEMQCN